MQQNRFTDPATGDFYDWLVNHTTEDESAKSRSITRTAPTGAVGLVKQQGEDGPWLLSLQGHITHRSQYREFLRWYALSRTQTIYFRDFDLQEYEVQITDFRPKRERKLPHSGRDPSTPYHRWTYTLVMEVYSFLEGDLADMGITA